MKYLALLFSVFLCLFGCAKRDVPSPSSSYFEDNGKVKVLSTTTMIDDLVAHIGGEFVDHIALVTRDLDPHSYELVKGDDEKIGFAQIAIGNGLHLEHGASLRYQLENHPHAVFLGEEIQKRVPSQIITVDGQLDPHVWMDISLWAEGIDAIVTALSAIDPEHALHYQRNGDDLRQAMLLTHRQIQQEFKGIGSSNRYLVTSHDAFHYFARAYLSEEEDWEKRCVAPEGLAPDGQLSTQDIQRVVDHLSEYQIGVVFPESNVNRDALKKIISSCKHSVQICDRPLYGDAMGDSQSGADSYLAMIQHNAKVLKEEWQKQSKLNH